MTVELPPPFDDLLDLLAEWDPDDEDTLELVGQAWTKYGPPSCDLLHDYVGGRDLSERTERALFVLSHMIAGYGETGSFPDFCRLGMASDRLYSVLTEAVVFVSYPRMLISTFDGSPAPLFALIEQPEADDSARRDALLVLAYLTRTSRIPESITYDYLAKLPTRLGPAEASGHWTGYALTVAILGFAGLAGVVESAFQKSWVDRAALSPTEFWDTLRDAQQNPNDMTSPIWDGLEPIGDPIDYLLSLDDLEDDGNGADPMPKHGALAEPVRNPLRNIGRNDPCPCGSGKKYNKCSLKSAGA